MRIGSSDRVLLVGKTNSGKTFLARWFLTAQPRLIIIDSKGLMTPVDWDAERMTLAELKTVILDDEFRAILTLDADDLIQLPAIVLAAGECVVYVDEAYTVFQSKAGKKFSELWTRGREHGISVWAATQRPTWISLFLLSETEHYFVFRLTWPDDLERMRMLLELQVMPKLKQHEFIYAQPEAGVYYRATGGLTVSQK